MAGPHAGEQKKTLHESHASESLQKNENTHWENNLHQDLNNLEYLWLIELKNNHYLLG